MTNIIIQPTNLKAMSDTPETDANLYGWAVEAELSRKLERERDEARRLATEYRDAYSKHFKDGYSGIASLPWENTKADQP
jgi:hypothetical protein